MRVLITSWAWPSHYFPMVPLGWALRAAGHDVRVASQPALAAVIMRSGLPAVVTGRDVDFPALFQRHLGELLFGGSGNGPRGQPNGAGNPSASPAPQDPERVRAMTLKALGLFVPVAEAMVDELLVFARQWRPDLIVYEPTTWAGPLVAAMLDIPAVRHLWGVDYTAQSSELEPVVLAPVLERLGLDAVETLGAVTIDNCPPSMQVDAVYHRHLMRYIPYNGPGAAAGWLLEPARRARVCVTWGTSSARLAQPGPVRPVLEAVSELGVEIIAALSADDARSLGAPPAGVRVVEQLPLHLLLPSCDLVVHQGGMGTTMTGLTCGLPQLVIPKLPDQLFNAVRLASTGACRVVPQWKADAGKIGDAARELLESGAHRQAAQSLRDEIARQPPPAEAVRMLQALARERFRSRTRA